MSFNNALRTIIEYMRLIKTIEEDALNFLSYILETFIKKIKASLDEGNSLEDTFKKLFPNELLKQQKLEYHISINTYRKRIDSAMFTTISEKSGLELDTQVVQNYFSTGLDIEDLIYITAALEYIAYKLIDLSRDTKGNTITESDFRKAILKDVEINKLIGSISKKKKINKEQEKIIKILSLFYPDNHDVDLLIEDVTEGRSNIPEEELVRLLISYTIVELKSEVRLDRDYKSDYFDFLSSYNEKVKNAIISFIKYSKFKDFNNLDDLYEFYNFLINPPFFLSKNSRMKSSLVLNYLNLKDFSKEIISGNEPKEFKLKIIYQDEVKKYKIPSVFLEKFDYFKNLIKFNGKHKGTLEVSSKETGDDLVEYLISGAVTFDEGESSDERLQSLYEIADMLQLMDLVEICKSFLNDEDLDSDTELDENI